jgi:hypothetical protein
VLPVPSSGALVGRPVPFGPVDLASKTIELTVDGSSVEARPPAPHFKGEPATVTLTAVAASGGQPAMFVAVRGGGSFENVRSLGYRIRA